MRMKIMAMLMVLAFPIFMKAQQTKVAGIRYFAGVPSGIPTASGGEVAIDTSSGCWYVFGRDMAAWVPVYFFGKLAGCVGPAYTPTDKQPEMVVNGCDSLYAWNGSAWRHLNAAGDGGGVTSVGLTMPPELTVSSSPVTTAGTISAAWATQPPNRVFASHGSGSTTAPTFRSLVAADIPSLTASKISNFKEAVQDTVGTWVTGTGGIAVQYSDAANTLNFSYQVPSSLQRLTGFGAGISGGNVYGYLLDSLVGLRLSVYEPTGFTNSLKMVQGAANLWEKKESVVRLDSSYVELGQEGASIKVRKNILQLGAINRTTITTDTVWVEPFTSTYPIMRLTRYNSGTPRYLDITQSPSQSANTRWVYPSTNGSAGQALLGDGTGAVGYGNVLTSEVDASVTNEIQTLSTGANTLSLSLGGGTVTADTDPTNDLTTSTPFVGDVAGFYNTFEISANAVGSTELASTSVVPGTYSAATFTVDADGRITGASSGSGGSGSTSVGSVVSDSAVVWNEYPCSYVGHGWENTVWGLGSQGVSPPELGRPGIGTLTVTATSVAGAIYSWGNGNTGVVLPHAGIRLRASVQLPSLLVNADSIVARVGFFPRTANLNKGRQGAYFDVRTDGSGAYIVYAVTAVNAAATLTNVTGLAGTLSAWKTLEVRYSSSTSVGFFIDNTLVATHTTNIDPGTVNRLFPAVCAGRTGTGVTGMNTMKVDYILFVTPSSRL